MKLAAVAAKWEADGNAPGGLPAFDLDHGQGSGAGGVVDWQAGAPEGWSSSGYSPYSGKAAKGGSNFSDYLMKLFTGSQQAAGSFDSMGGALNATKPGKPGKSGNAGAR